MENLSAHATQTLEAVEIGLGEVIRSKDGREWLVLENNLENHPVLAGVDNHSSVLKLLGFEMISTRTGQFRIHRDVRRVVRLDPEHPVVRVLTSEEVQVFEDRFEDLSTDWAD